MSIRSVALKLAILLTVVVPLQAQDPSFVRHFDYNKTASLDIKTIDSEKRGEVIVYNITYASPKGGVVPAYLVVPKGKGKFAGIIWGHWYWENSPMRNRKEFLDEAVALAPAGVISLLPDGPVARPGFVQDNTPLNTKQVSDMVQAVIDMRRGFDLLSARADVDPKRLAFVGHSYNAMVGAFLSGVDRRAKAYVLMAGALSDEVYANTSEYKEYREKIGPEKFDAFTEEYKWTDQGKYVAHAAPAFVYMQWANQEKFLTPALVKQFDPYVSEPKRMSFYEAPHSLNAEARRDRIKFLTEQLKLKPTPAAVIAKVPELYQPPEQN
jgi:dienelactone hydrolase